MRRDEVVSRKRRRLNGGSRSGVLLQLLQRRMLYSRSGELSDL